MVAKQPLSTYERASARSSRASSPQRRVREAIGQGDVAKKGKRWYAVFYDGVNPATGKEQRRWVPAGTRRGDAEKLVTELVKRRNEGETVVTDKVTLGHYLVERWLPGTADPPAGEHLRLL
jgi:hypothetical protein